MKKTGALMLFVLLVAVAVAAVAAEATDVSGTWTMTLTTRRGERTSTLVFVQDGEKLTVTSKNDRGESSGTGTITGNAIEWSISHETPMGTMTTVYKGTVDGDSMSGTADSHGHSAEWKAVRTKSQ